MNEHSSRLVVIGAGSAGLSAAVAAQEKIVAANTNAEVVLLDRASSQEAGGNTRWTDAYLRLEDVYELADGFAEEMLAFSNGQTDSAYIEALVNELPETMDWIQGHGVRFRRRPTYFVTASRPRMMPVGGGESIIRNLSAAAHESGVDIRYEHRVVGLDKSGHGLKITVETPEGQTEIIADSVIIASGGFEGNAQMLVSNLGECAREMRPIAPGGELNTGEVIELAIGMGAARSGEWENFHGEPVDSRSAQPEASVMTFGYGIIVDENGQRFFDEGSSTADETYEDLARAILQAPGQRAFLLSDAAFYRVPGIERGMLTDKPPIQANDVRELASSLGLPERELQETIRKYNSSTPQDLSAYDATQLDGTSTDQLTPPKSNWALPIEEPPLIGVPLSVDIVFTYGGVATDSEGHVLDQDNSIIPRIYAAGECTGIYYGKYPGATSVLRSLIFGRVSGAKAAQEIAR